MSLKLVDQGLKRNRDSGRIYQHVLHVYVKNDFAGWCSLEIHPHVKNGVITHTHLFAWHRGKGHGSRLYRALIKFAWRHGYKIYSSERWRVKYGRRIMSDDAERCWHSLLKDKRFQIVRSGARFKVIGVKV